MAHGLFSRGFHFNGLGTERARRAWRRASEPFQSRAERPTPCIVGPGMSAKVNIISRLCLAELGKPEAQGLQRQRLCALSAPPLLVSVKIDVVRNSKADVVRLSAVFPR